MIFVDTSFWVALFNPRDARTGESRTLFERFASTPLFTSNEVRGETWTFLNRKVGHAGAVAFLDALTGSARLIVERITVDAEDEAIAWLRRHDERRYSFVDATSFQLMRQLRISRAFAFDGDFSAAGFEELRA